MTRWLGRARHRLYAWGIQSTAGLSLPDFLGIGAQKSGTSWLHLNLRMHPDAFLPELKELHYFDERFHEPLKNYARYFSPASSRIKGEITPAYAILPMNRVRYIHAILPNLRLIFLMRNPIDRAWSHALMILATHPGRKVEEIGADEFIRHFRGEANLARGDYEMVLQRWQSVFPPERFYLGFFEDISTRPAEMLREVFRHLGLRQEIDLADFPLHRKVYAGPGIAMPPPLRAVLRELYLPKLERLRRRLGNRIDAWMA